MKRSICIHGHFYQPPRENPWTGYIEEQKSAAPFHDWNERIHFECYQPNTCTQLLATRSSKISTVNNYAHISFNFGPTLLSWMKINAKDTYDIILNADKESMANYSGHGSAIAQVYNHMIMPLSNDRDKTTQIKWGKRDFEFRFGRKPEGMWLAETAVDYRTLELLADNDIAYTILSPKQAKRVRRIEDQHWNDVNEENLDTQVPYLCKLSNGKSIALFFYNGQIANEAAFGKLLENGEVFSNRLLGEHLTSQEEPRVVHIANDGETYGHHHDFGNIALAYLIKNIQENDTAHITIYGEFLEKNPPKYEVEIINDSSWSCYHGVERWKAHCGCRIDPKKKWNQHWREHLRNALDWLREELTVHYENTMAGYFQDPWDIRNRYVDVLLENTPESCDFALWSHAKRPLNDDDKKTVTNLLDMQKFAMYMYTSCGWFFDDISGIETVQILQYACRTMQLCKQTGGKDLEPEFISLIEKAKSNLPDWQNGKSIYEKLVKPAEPTPTQT